MKYNSSLVGLDLTNMTSNVPVRFWKVVLTDAEFVGAEAELIITDSECRFIDLTGAVLTGSSLFKCDLTGSFAPFCKLAFSELEEVNLTEADLRNAFLEGTQAKGVCFKKADLRGADLSEGDYKNCDFTDADMRGADLSNSAFYDSNFSGVKLDEKSDLRGAIIPPHLRFLAERSSAKLSFFSSVTYH